MLVGLLLTLGALAQEPFTPRELVDLPDPGAAAQLSGGLGFGAGHFYAAQPARGAVFATTQLAGALVMGGAYAWRLDRPVRWADNGGPAVAVTGLVLFAGSRVIDQALAPYSARRTARKRLAE